MKSYHLKEVYQRIKSIGKHYPKYNTDDHGIAFGERFLGLSEKKKKKSLI